MSENDFKQRVEPSNDQNFLQTGESPNRLEHDVPHFYFVPGDFLASSLRVAYSGRAEQATQPFAHMTVQYLERASSNLVLPNCCDKTL